MVLAIGLEGNPRKLGAPGEDLERVQYQLDDPKEFRDETILVVGAGDSAIENALALAEQNDVVDRQPRQGIQPREGRQPQCRGGGDRRSAPSPELLTTKPASRASLPVRPADRR